MNTKKLLLFTFLIIKSAPSLHAMEKFQSTTEALEIIATHLLQDPDIQVNLARITNQATLDHQTPSDILFIKYRAMTKIDEYTQYRAAEVAHKKYNTADTSYMFDLCKSELNNTKEYQEWLLSIKDVRDEKPIKLQTKKITPSSDEMYSDNVVNKHLIMEQTPEYMQYEEAKQYHKIYNTSDTQAMVDACKVELYNTKACQEWLHAMDQENHVIDNIMKSERWNNMQQTTYNFSEASEAEKKAKNKFAEELKKRSVDALNAVQNTLEFQRCLEANAQYEKDKSSLNLLKLKQCKRALETIPETLEYCKAQADKRLLRAIKFGYVGPIIVEQNYPSCLVDYIEQEKTMRKLDLDVLRIRTKEPYLIYIMK
jgi:hypothetical protein